MHLSHRCRPFIAASSLLAMFAATLTLAQKAPESSNELDTIIGVPLDPSAYGPGVVETWAEVEERARNAPPELQKGRNGEQGKWMVPPPRATDRTHSGIHNIINKWGDTNMGISFPRAATVHGAYFAGQAAKGVWASAIRAHGFRHGQLIASTDWFEGIGETPEWFEMNLAGIDRIEIEAKPVVDGGGWYAMDDFTFTMAGDAPDHGKQLEPTVIDFEDCHWNQVLTGSDYAGLTWETGTGDFDQAIPGPRPIEDEVKPLPGEIPQDGGVDGGSGTDATAPNLVFGFQGPTFGGSFPPDTCGATGPLHFVTVVNTNFSVWRKSDGVRLINQSLSSFFGGGAGDPRILYDTHSGRWIAIDTNFSTLIFLAVSTSSDPTGSWFKTSFSVAPNLDFPTLGVDEKGIYIGVWPASGASMTLLAIQKAPLIAPNPSMGQIVTFAGLQNDLAFQPALTYGVPSPEGAYVISTLGSTTLRLRRVTWTSSTTASLTNLTNVTVPSYSNPPNAPAQGSATAIHTGDVRLVNAVYRDGFLYTCHTINVGGRAACRWYKINPANSTLVVSGTVSDPVRHYYYPSIAVNGLGDMVMGMSGSHSAQFVAAYYTGRSSSDAPGEMATPEVLRAGNASYQLLDGVGRNRWGDYSLTTVDPADDNTMWTIQEFAFTQNNWGTHIGKLVVNAAPVNNDCESPITVVAGSHAFSTVFATTDGPDEPGICTFNGSSNIQSDVWYKFLAQCTGNATISLCGSTFDTKVAIYPSSLCPGGSGTVIACNDDFCGTSSQVTFPATAGTVYRVRIGSRTGVTGTGTMVITCEGNVTGACCAANGTCTNAVTQSDCVNSGGTYQGNNTNCLSVQCVSPCPADTDGDGQVNVNDLLAVINSWGACPGCPADTDGDGQVNVNDLLAVINAWGACP